MLHCPTLPVKTDEKGVTPMASPKILVEEDVPMRARDGTVLRSNIFRPETAERLPMLVERTMPLGSSPHPPPAITRRKAAHESRQPHESLRRPVEGSVRLRNHVLRA